MANCAQCGQKLPPFSLRKICQWCVRHEAALAGAYSAKGISHETLDAVREAEQFKPSQ